MFVVPPEIPSGDKRQIEVLKGRPTRRDRESNGKRTAHLPNFHCEPLIPRLFLDGRHGLLEVLGGHRY